jgi:hypothetical protein
MPVCPGASEIQPGVPTVITLDPTFMGSLLPPSLGWLVPFVPFIPTFTLSLTDFCELDPPEIPTFTTEDFIALVTRERFGLVTAATFKLTQLMHCLAWYRFCRCADLSTPDPYTAPTAPSDLPSINPPGYVSPTGPVGAPCETSIVSLSVGYSDPDTFSALGVLIPTGATSYRLRANINTANFSAFARLVFNSDGSSTWTAFGPYVQRAAGDGAYTNNGAVAGVNYVDAARPSGVGYWAVFLEPNNVTGGAGTATGTFTIEWYCGTNTPTTPPSTFDPCVACPPDPNMVGLIAQLQTQILGITELLTLVQRQAVPFATIDGDAHVDLDGEGSFAVQGLVGARVTTTGLPAGGFGVTDGEPQTFYGTGWIRWGDDTGWRERTFLDTAVKLSVPYAASAMTRIGWALPPGVEITVVELEREP